MARIFDITGKAVESDDGSIKLDLTASPEQTQPGPIPPPAPAGPTPRNQMPVLASYKGSETISADPRWVADYPSTSIGRVAGTITRTNHINAIPGNSARLWCSINNYAPRMTIDGKLMWTKTSTDSQKHGFVNLDANGNEGMATRDGRYFIRNRQYAIGHTFNIAESDIDGGSKWCNLIQVYTRGADNTSRQHLAVFLTNGELWGEVRGGRNGAVSERFYTPKEIRPKLPLGKDVHTRLEFNFDVDGSGYAIVWVDVGDGWKKILSHEGLVGSDLNHGSSGSMPLMAWNAMGFYTPNNLVGTIDDMYICADPVRPDEIELIRESF